MTGGKFLKNNASRKVGTTTIGGTELSAVWTKCCFVKKKQTAILEVSKCAIEIWLPTRFTKLKYGVAKLGKSQMDFALPCLARS